MNLPDAFVTSRLSAERLRAEHADDIHRMLQDPEHMAMIGGVPDESETVVFMTRNLEHWERHGFGVWILYDRTQHVLVGRVLLRQLTLDGVDEIELGYGLQPAYWGIGLAAEAAGACLVFARETLGAKSVVAVSRPDHLRSHRVLEKLGMHHERDFVIHGVIRTLHRSS